MNSRPDSFDAFSSREPVPTSLENTSGRNHEVDRLWPFAFLVRLDLECDALSFHQILQSGPFHGRDVDKHIAASVVGLDEAVAAFSVEELDRPSHGHRETSPRIAAPLRSFCVLADRTFAADTFPARCFGHPGQPA